MYYITVPENSRANNILGNIELMHPELRTSHHKNKNYNIFCLIDAWCKEQNIKLLQAESDMNELEFGFPEKTDAFRFWLVWCAPEELNQLNYYTFMLDLSKNLSISNWLLTQDNKKYFIFRAFDQCLAICFSDETLAMQFKLTYVS